MIYRLKLVSVICNSNTKPESISNTLLKHTETSRLSGTAKEKRLCIYQSDAPRYDQKTRETKTCADVLLGSTELNTCKSQDNSINITLCPALAAGIYSL